MNLRIDSPGKTPENFSLGGQERFHSRGQHLCKFIVEQKRAFALEKSSAPTGLSWYLNVAAVSLFWKTNMAAVTSCENAPYVYLYFGLRSKTTDVCCHGCARMVHLLSACGYCK